MKLYLSKHCQQADIQAEEQYGISIHDLMLRAAEGLKKHISFDNGIIVCGTGKNGGDGYALATLLPNFRVLSLGLCMNESANYYKNKIENVIETNNLSVIKDLFSQSECIIDCLLGSGLNRDVEGIYAEVIHLMNQSGKYIISCDLPSGLNDIGETKGVCVKAHKTVTFDVLKVAHIIEEGSMMCGDVFVESIGIPQEVYDSISSNCELHNIDELKQLLPIRERNANKSTFGKCLIVGGSENMSGALMLCVKAALRSGIGVVSYVTEKSILDTCRIQVNEAMSASFENLSEMISKHDFIVFGCGLGRGNEMKKYLKLCLKSEKPMIIDADGLYALKDEMNLLKDRKSPVILTPHVLEMARMCHVNVSEVCTYRYRTAYNFISSYPCVTLVLKGMNTMILHQNQVHFIRGENTALSKGGSGDVLCGLIAGMFGQNKNDFYAALAGCLLHSALADYCRKEYSEYATLPSDLINACKKIFITLLS